MIKPGHVYLNLIGNVKTGVYTQVSDDFVARVQETYNTLPAPIRRLFEMKRAVLGFIEQNNPCLVLGLGAKHSDFIEGGTDDVAGSTEKVSIALAEYILTDTDTGPVYKKAKNIEGIFRHELGHVFNLLCEYPADNHKFMEAYARDVETLGGIIAMREKGLGYFAQDGQNNPAFAAMFEALSNFNAVFFSDANLKSEEGRYEIFAEAWAHYFGGSAVTELDKLFPQTFSYVAQIMPRLLPQIEAAKDHTTVTQNVLWASGLVSPEITDFSDAVVEKRLERASAYISGLRNNYLTNLFYDTIDYIRQNGGIRTNSMLGVLSTNLKSYALFDHGKDFSQTIGAFMESEDLDARECKNKISELLEQTRETERKKTTNDISVAIPAIRNALIDAGDHDLAGTFLETIQYIRQSKLWPDGYADFAIRDLCRACLLPVSYEDSYDVPVYIMVDDHRMEAALTGLADAIRETIKPNGFEPSANPFDKLTDAMSVSALFATKSTAEFHPPLSLWALVKKLAQTVPNTQTCTIS